MCLYLSLSLAIIVTVTFVFWFKILIFSRTHRKVPIERLKFNFLPLVYILAQNYSHSGFRYNQNIVHCCFRYTPRIIRSFQERFFFWILASPFAYGMFIYNSRSTFAFCLFLAITESDGYCFLDSYNEWRQSVFSLISGRSLQPNFGYID